MTDLPAEITCADIVCVGYGAWGGLWGHLHHVMARLARRNRVLYVEGAPPAPGGRWHRRGWHRLAAPLVGATAGWVGGLKSLDANLHVLRPSGVAAGAAAGRWLDQRLFVRLVQHHATRLGLHRPILWCAFPSGADLVGRLDERFVVYHDLDDYAGLPGVAPAVVKDQEARLLSRADVVFAASGALFRGVLHRHANAYYMPAATEVAHWARGGSAPADLARLPRPLMGYAGALAARKIDVGLLAHLARARPDWSIALIGPLHPRERRFFQLALGDLTNVHFLGRKAYEELPACYAALDAMILPYQRNARTRARFPLQFAEALAAGKPQVVTELDAIAHYRLSRTLCRVARDQDEFLQFAEDALAEEPSDERLALRREHARRYDLDARMRDLETLVMAGLERH